MTKSIEFGNKTYAIFCDPWTTKTYNSCINYKLMLANYFDKSDDFRQCN